MVWGYKMSWGYEKHDFVPLRTPHQRRVSEPNQAHNVDQYPRYDACGPVFKVGRTGCPHDFVIEIDYGRAVTRVKECAMSMLKMAGNR